VAGGELGLWAGFLINGFLVYGPYTVLHETVHGNVSGFGQPPPWYNELFGYLSGFIMAIPLSVHRVNHGDRKFQPGQVALAAPARL
jgi:fatty acid desaturase